MFVSKKFYSFFLFSLLMVAIGDAEDLNRSERRDLREGGAHTTWTQGVGTLFFTANLDGSPSGGVQKLRLADSGLCKSEEHHHQKSLGFCSTTLISPSLIITPSYCATNCNETRVTFAFRSQRQGNKTPESLPENEIYSCKEVIPLENGGDYPLTVIRLDRPVENRLPVTLQLKKKEMQPGKRLTFYSYPHGLPLKRSRGNLTYQDNKHGWGYYEAAEGGTDAGGAIYYDGYVHGIHFSSGFKDRVEGADCDTWADFEKDRGNQDAFYIPVSHYADQLKKLITEDGWTAEAEAGQ